MLSKLFFVMLLAFKTCQSTESDYFMISPRQAGSWLCFAEDSAMTRKIWEKTLSDLNITYAYKICKDGLELEKTIEENKENPPLFIFTDNHMPNKKGVDAIKEIRTYLKNIPIYLYTSSIEDVQDDFLKDYNVDLLSKTEKFKDKISFILKSLGIF